jgi:NAD(P)-dependent dehydrogenase (short-subunit alcohol dehydrogenase family)
MTKVNVVIGAGSIGQAIARRVSAGKHVPLADLRQDRALRARHASGSGAIPQAQPAHVHHEHLREPEDTVRVRRQTLARQPPPGGRLVTPQLWPAPQRGLGPQPRPVGRHDSGGLRRSCCRRS